MRVKERKWAVLLTPEADGGWRFDICSASMVTESLSSVRSNGDDIWRDTDVTTYGFRRTQDRALGRALARVNKISKRYANLDRPGRVEKVAT